MLVETLEDIEELKECFKNLNLFDESSLKNGKMKKAKIEDSNDKNKKEAYNVLVDFLIGLLDKPHSFMRDLANYCFKNFCLDALDGEGIERLLRIISTKNEEAD